MSAGTQAIIAFPPHIPIFALRKYFRQCNQGAASDQGAGAAFARVRVLGDIFVIIPFGAHARAALELIIITMLMRDRGTGLGAAVRCVFATHVGMRSAETSPDPK